MFYNAFSCAISSLYYRSSEVLATLAKLATALGNDLIYINVKIKSRINSGRLKSARQFMENAVGWQTLHGSSLLKGGAIQEKFG